MGDHKIAIVINTITTFVKTQKFRIHSFRENIYCKERVNKVFEGKTLMEEFAKDKSSPHHIIPH